MMKIAMIAYKLIARNAAANALADSIDTSRTTTVNVSDIKPGDVLTALGAKTFLHPVIIAKVNHVDQFGLVHLIATNGWFTSKPCRKTETATRVLRISEGG